MAGLYTFSVVIGHKIGSVGYFSLVIFTLEIGPHISRGNQFRDYDCCCY